MMPNVGPLEIVIVLIIALIVLGPKKLPDFGRSVGLGMRESKPALTTSDEPTPPRRNPDAEAPPRAEQSA